MNTFKIVSPKDKQFEALKRDNKETRQEFAELKSKLEQDKIDYFDFTKKLTEIFENALARLEAVDNTLDITPIAEQVKEFKAEIADVKKTIRDQKLVSKVNVAPPDLSKIEALINTIPKAIEDALEDEDEVTPKEIRKFFKDVRELLEKLSKMEWVSQGTTIVGGGAATTEEPNYAVRIDNASEANTVYIGKASIGSLNSAAVWQIAKLDTTSGMNKVWADGSDDFNQVWDDRTDLDYS